MIFLSHTINSSTPTYGNRNIFKMEKTSDISKGDVANDTSITSTVHIGTHIDMPYHFYENGQTINDLNENFWLFKKPLIIEIEPKSQVIKEELIDKLNGIKNENFDILIVKTGICYQRDKDIFWESNYGFHPDIYDFLSEKFPLIRVLGFDSISVSSFSNRMLGREAHKRFLNPLHPILLLEDMKLDSIHDMHTLNKIIVAPLRIENCDGLPCTVLGFEND